MSACWLCGNEGEGHHLGCLRASNPDLTKEEAVRLGLLPAPEGEEPQAPDKIEILREGSMTTEPWNPEEYDPNAPEGDDEGGDDSLENCEYPDCTNQKYSDHPRVKYCEEHRDPKNRKE